MKGIDETKDVVVFLAATGKMVDELKGKKLNILTILPKVTKLLPKAIKAVNGIQEVPEEFMDLTDDERADLCNMVKEEIDLQDDKVEQIVEYSLDLLINFSKIIGLFKKK